MNHKQKIVAHLVQFGRTACEALERPLHIRDATTRISEINKRHKQTHGSVLIKSEVVYEPNALGEIHAATYYEIAPDGGQPDLFKQ
jgi:hypothetical protein